MRSSATTLDQTPEPNIDSINDAEGNLSDKVMYGLVVISWIATCKGFLGFIGVHTFSDALAAPFTSVSTVLLSTLVQISFVLFFNLATKPGPIVVWLRYLFFVAATVAALFSMVFATAFWSSDVFNFYQQTKSQEVGNVQRQVSLAHDNAMAKLDDLLTQMSELIESTKAHQVYEERSSKGDRYFFWNDQETELSLAQRHLMVFTTELDAQNTKIHLEGWSPSDRYVHINAYAPLFRSISSNTSIQSLTRAIEKARIGKALFTNSRKPINAMHSEYINKIQSIVDSAEGLVASAADVKVNYVDNLDSNGSYGHAVNLFIDLVKLDYDKFDSNAWRSIIFGVFVDVLIILLLIHAADRKKRRTSGFDSDVTAQIDQHAAGLKYVDNWALKAGFVNSDEAIEDLLEHTHRIAGTDKCGWIVCVKSKNKSDIKRQDFLRYLYTAHYAMHLPCPEKLVGILSLDKIGLEAKFIRQGYYLPPKTVKSLKGVYGLVSPKTPDPNMTFEQFLDLSYGPYLDMQGKRREVQALRNHFGYLKSRRLSALNDQAVDEVIAGFEVSNVKKSRKRKLSNKTVSDYSRYLRNAIRYARSLCLMPANDPVGGTPSRSQADLRAVS